MPINCTTDPITQCVDCPGIPTTPAQLPTLVSTPIFGWNAGALSVQHLGAACYTEFSVGPMAAGVVGLVDDFSDVTDPTQVRLGWYVAAVGGRTTASAYERGQLVSSPRVVRPSTALRIERIGTLARYLVDGEVIHTSQHTALGMLAVQASLYASGDTVV